MNILVHKKVEKTVQNIDCNFVKKFVGFFRMTKRCWLEESCQRFLKWSHDEKSIYSQQSQLLYLLALQVGADIDDVIDQGPPCVSVRSPHSPHVPEHPGHADQLLCVLLLRVYCQAEQHLGRGTFSSYCTLLELPCQAQNNQITTAGAVYINILKP